MRRGLTFGSSLYFSPFPPLLSALRFSVICSHESLSASGGLLFFSAPPFIFNVIRFLMISVVLRTAGRMYEVFISAGACVHADVSFFLLDGLEAVSRCCSLMKQLTFNIVKPIRCSELSKFDEIPI